MYYKLPNIFAASKAGGLYLFVLGNFSTSIVEKKILCM